MKRIWAVLVVLALLAATFSLNGCQSTNKIGDIQANPGQFQDKEVQIRGTVGDTFWLALLQKGAYQIGDRSGTIWVVTIQPPPQKGVELSTTGKVSTAVTIGDRNLGTVITETHRK